MRKYTQSGRSMIEMLGVLAIVGVLSAGGIAGYSMAMQSYKTNQLIERMQLLANRTISIYKGNYVGVSKDNLINSGKVSAADFVNPFGGSLAVGTAPSGNNNSFWVVSSADSADANIPQEACVDILTMDWGSEVDAAHVYNSSGTAAGGYSTLPVEVSTAMTACSGGDKKIQLRFH